MITRTCIRSGCKNKFSTIQSDSKKYCSRNCAATVNNTGRTLSEDTKAKIAKANTTTGVYVRKYKLCLHCVTSLGPRQLKYCSNECQSNYNYHRWLESWKSGVQDGSVGIMTRSISGFLRRYIHEKFNNKCTKCGWNEVHLITKKVPLEIEHIDGNSENNTEENLTLLCPNCHSLTSFYRGLNRGNGRKWRMDKYIKNV